MAVVLTTWVKVIFRVKIIYFITCNLLCSCRSSQINSVCPTTLRSTPTSLLIWERKSFGLSSKFLSMTQTLMMAAQVSTLNCVYNQQEVFKEKCHLYLRSYGPWNVCLYPFISGVKLQEVEIFRGLVKVSIWGRRPIRAVLNSGFCTMKRLGLFLLSSPPPPPHPLDGMLVHRKVAPSIMIASTH